MNSTEMPELVFWAGCQMLTDILDRAEGLHDDDFFLRIILGHKQPHLVAPIHADQGEPDARVSRRRLDNCSAGRELSFLLCPPNDPNCRAIFYASARIEVFQLGENVR